MIKSPPLDIGNLIAILRTKKKFDIKLLDLRIDIINDDYRGIYSKPDINIFNDFQRCLEHLRNKEDSRIVYAVKKIFKEINTDDFNTAIFSVAVLEQFSLQYLISSLCLAKELKKNYPAKKVIFFGNCPKAHIRKVIKIFDFVDAFGENGDEYAIVRYLEKATTISLEGISYRENKKIFFPIEDRKISLNSYPLPDFSLFNLERYKTNNRLVLPYEISRGCTNDCFFCYYIHKNHVYSKSIDKVINDLTYLSKRYSTWYFHFMDAAINFDEEYLDLLCQAFAKKLPNLRWSALAIPNINYQLLIKMKTAGCLQLRWGVEYASKRMLDIINKKTSRQEIKEVLKNSHSLGIYNYITLLSGLHIEKKNDINQTVHFIEEMAPYIDAAKECVWGELGHFSLNKLNDLLNHKKDIFVMPKKKYDNVLKKNNIYSHDIIEVMTKKINLSFLLVPNEAFPKVIKEGEGGDEKAPHHEVFSTISYLKKELKESIDIKYYNFVSIFSEIKLFWRYLGKHPYDYNRKISRIAKLIIKFLDKSDYLFFYIPLWAENLKPSAEIAKIIKSIYPESKIIFFGPCCKLYSKEILGQYSFIDYVFTSEPEEAAKDLVTNKSTEDIFNIAHLRNKKICSHKRKGLDIHSHASYSFNYLAYFSFLNKYKLNSFPFLYFELSRGCIYNCFFCSLLTERKLRIRNVHSAVYELMQVLKHGGTRHIYFIDNELNFDNDYLSRFLDLVTKADNKFLWSAYMIAKGIDGRLIEKMKKAGCVHIRWGIESVNPKRQQMISKKLDSDEVSEILRLAHKQAIKNQVGFTVGYPYECEKDKVMIVDFIEKNRQNIDCVNLYRFKPRRNSLISRTPEKFGIEILREYDTLWQDEVPFNEINGLDWRLKKEQQIYYQSTISGKIKELKLASIDPEIFFKNLIINKGKQ